MTNIIYQIWIPLQFVLPAPDGVCPSHGVTAAVLCARQVLEVLQDGWTASECQGTARWGLHALNNRGIYLH